MLELKYGEILTISFDLTLRENLFIKLVNTMRFSFYLIGIIYAEAEGEPGMPMPIKCAWFRIKNERTYQIPEISSNVYQLSAEDIECKIRVEATPMDEESFHGKAYGEFGPIELDPSAR